MIKGVETQKELNLYNNLFMKCYKMDLVMNNLRGLQFKFKFYPWIAMLNWLKGFPSDFHPFIPGLEMKLALESA